MKTITFLISIILIASSCSPQKRINRLMDKHPEMIPVREKMVRDSVVSEKEILREVPVEIPGDTTYIEVPIDCPDQEIVISETSKSSTEANIETGKIRIRTVTKTDTVYIPVKDTEKVTESHREDKTIVPKKYIPKLYKWTLWGFFVLLGALAVFLYIKIR